MVTSHCFEESRELKATSVHCFAATRKSKLAWLAMYFIAAAALWSFTGTAHAATLAYWRFEPGALTIDSAGGNTLSNTGVTSSLDVAPSAPGVGSANFDGNQTLFQTIGTLDLSGATDLTVEWFMKTTQSAVAAVFAHPDGGTNPGSIGAFINDVNELEGYQRGGAGTYVKSTTLPTNDGAWRHFAMTITGAASDTSRVQFYVDGVNVGIEGGFGGTGTPAFLDNTFVIGALSPFGFNGLLDELRISDAILTPSQFLNAPPAAVVPEPSTCILLGLGALGLRHGTFRRRRRG